MMNQQLSNLLRTKRKNTILKSVFVTNEFIDKMRLIEIEAYDKTGYNALNTSISRYDKAMLTIEKALTKYFSDKEEKILVRVCSDEYGIIENIFYVNKGKTLNELILENDF